MLTEGLNHESLVYKDSSRTNEQLCHLDVDSVVPDDVAIMLQHLLQVRTRVNPVVHRCLNSDPPILKLSNTDSNLFNAESIEYWIWQQ